MVVNKDHQWISLPLAKPLQSNAVHLANEISARWELESHLQNAPLILEDCLHCVRAEDQCRHRDRQNQKKGLMVALKSIKPQEHLQLKDRCLLGAYMQGEIAFGMLNLRGWSYMLCIGAATTVILDALASAGPTL